MTPGSDQADVLGRADTNVTATHHNVPPHAPWRCPVCRGSLGLLLGERRWVCPKDHSFDIAKEGYVNLLPVQPKGKAPGDSADMVNARRRFLASSAYDPLSNSVAAAIALAGPGLVVDVGCGEGRHTRFLEAPLVMGIDVAKVAVAAAARNHPEGWYAVASAKNLPLPDASVDVAVSVFAPVFEEELARVVPKHGLVIVAGPGPHHLGALRALVYEQPRPHMPKVPIAPGRWFDKVGEESTRFAIALTDTQALCDLFAMTPYLWHGPRDMGDRLRNGIPGQLEGEVVLSMFRRL
ncbi:MAG TPA: methyltransferase domain-containing protein [Acidimicrobiales bacterium]|nr:methyltransferase domain-containing protein [Acidimicrobiales bacterium]